MDYNSPSKIIFEKNTSPIFGTTSYRIKQEMRFKYTKWKYYTHYHHTVYHSTNLIQY